MARGMRRVAVHARMGFKHVTWHYVDWFELRLAEPSGEPAEPIPLPDLEDDAERARAVDGAPASA